MSDVVIDLDTPAPAATPPPAGRRGWSRAATVAVFALLAAAPATAPTPMSVAHRLPVPSYCTGAPMPGGRLNIVEGDIYVILDGPTRTVISTGSCPHR
ncbi:hypothetical protein Daura_13550 [Dactylosporangium aurantiacum]|uniref:Uncharacterized protein n=1 Tax=Dactylosporangium aurantiacum TaxID=35754 RepID=A0A9Q9IND2_9ACTN|nr:hypothetical protein [Dactylosporangium aurantiacum]MDG6105562.1 hypothetical protein [Dactylosporangium aurantiacum]UWZ57095.1 hypothetical protein Daura_13550 [Dactylosporangium aurantiacum]